MNKKFTYYSNKNSYHEYVVFECEAEDIIEADMLLKAATGISAFKCPWLGVCIDTPPYDQAK